MSNQESTKKPGFLLRNKRSISIILVIGLVISGISLIKGKKTEDTEEIKSKIKEVQTELVDKDKYTKSSIEIVGAVSAETTVDIISNTGGTLKGLYIDVGDEVYNNQLVAQLSNNTSQTSLNNSKTALLNSESNLLSAERIANESINQARIAVEQAQVGLDNAKKSITVAELGLQTAKDNLANSSKLRDQSNIDIKNNAIISFNGYLNSIFSIKDQIGSLLDVDSNSPSDPSLGAKDRATLTTAKRDYNTLEASYNDLLALSPSQASIQSDLSKMISGLAQAEQILNSTINLLDNTVSGGTYSQSYIDAQKSSFISQRTAIVNSQNSAEAIAQSIANIPLLDEQQDDGLENAVKAADAQLEIALNAKTASEVALKNAEQALVSAEEAKNGQILNAKSQVDNTRGQLYLSQSQVADLSIKAPISGTITEKYVELGTEVSPGQKIAQVSKADNLKIVVNLNSEDIYKVKLGDKVMIDDKYEATITNIAPAADPLTKKVKVEILYDNSEKNLLQGTFVDISIPVEVASLSSEEAVYIPLRTLTITQNEKYVFVAREGKAKKILVETGITEGAMIEIVNGLSNGDELVIEGGKSLEDGDELSITN